MKTFLFLFLFAPVTILAQYNFSVTGEEIDNHLLSLPYKDSVVFYDEVFEEIEGASTEELFRVFNKWYMKFYGNNGTRLYDEEDKDRNKIEVDFFYTFRFWNDASFKTVTTRCQLRFYAQDGRARVVMTKLRYNLNEYNVVNIPIVRIIKGISRTKDQVTSEDPNYPYSIEDLVTRQASSEMWKRFLVSADIVTLKIMNDIEKSLRDFKKEEEEDKW